VPINLLMFVDGFSLLLDDCRGTTYPDSDWWQYSRTKLMNLLVGKEMARRLVNTGVEVKTAA